MLSVLLTWGHISWKILWVFSVCNFDIIVFIKVNTLKFWSGNTYSVVFFFNKAEEFNTIRFPGRTYTWFINDIFFIFFTLQCIKVPFLYTVFRKIFSIYEKIVRWVIHIKKEKKYWNKTIYSVRVAHEPNHRPPQLYS